MTWRMVRWREQGHILSRARASRRDHCCSLCSDVLTRTTEGCRRTTTRSGGITAHPRRAKDIPKRPIHSHQGPYIPKRPIHSHRGPLGDFLIFFFNTLTKTSLPSSQPPHPTPPHPNSFFLHCLSSGAGWYHIDISQPWYIKQK